MVLVVKSKDSKIPPRMQLGPSWRSPRDPKTGALLPEGKLWDFIEKVASCRREGKNRRDGATVSSRVLRLADQLGGQLFAEAEGAENKSKVPSRLSKEEVESVKRSLRHNKKRGKLQSSRPNL